MNEDLENPALPPPTSGRVNRVWRTLFSVLIVGTLGGYVAFALRGGTRWWVLANGLVTFAAISLLFAWDSRGLKRWKRTPGKPSPP